MGCVEAPGKQFHRLHHVELEKQSPPSLEGGGVREGRGKTSLGNGTGFKEGRGIWLQCRVSTGRGDVRRKGTEGRR